MLNMQSGLIIDSLTVKLRDSNKILLKDINLEVLFGDILYLLGPNGAGKTALLHTIMGSNFYQVVNGSIIFKQSNKKINLLNLSTDQRAKLGIYLSFQEPIAIEGLKTIDFLFNMYKLKHPNIKIEEFKQILAPLLKKLDLKFEFLEKDLNLDYSGGEKKRLEVLTLFLFKPSVILLDELDSGLDIDAEMQLFTLLYDYIRKHKIPTIVVSHNLRVIDILKPSKAVVLKGGQIVQRGSKEIVKRIIEQGYKFN